MRKTSRSKPGGVFRQSTSLSRDYSAAATALAARRARSLVLRTQLAARVLSWFSRLLSSLSLRLPMIIGPFPDQAHKPKYWVAWVVFLADSTH